MTNPQPRVRREPVKKYDVTIVAADGKVGEYNDVRIIDCQSLLTRLEVDESLLIKRTK